jgi:ribulose-5-phosphate 4-epimerase/fuculose-1-phosphate aldolase
VIDEDVARRDLAAAHRMAVYDGLCEGTWNHFSLMLDNERMLFTPGDRHWDTVEADSLLVLDGDLEAVRREYGTSFLLDYKIHFSVHQARPDARCALHVHSTYATALSLIDEDELLPASQLSLELIDRIAYNDRYDGFGPMEEQGERIAQALGDRAMLFMRGHGVIVVGRTVHEAYHDLYLLERACQTQLVALSSGRPVRVFDAADVAGVSHEDDGGAYARRHFDAMLELLESRHGSTYVR